MNAKQLVKLLQDYECLKKVFICISDINRLPTDVMDHYPQLYIINPGKHWVCVIFYDSSKAKYFDSLGKPTAFYGNDLVKFIDNNSRKCSYIHRQLQSNTSDICGLYVIFFAGMKLCYHMSIKNFLDMFTENVYENDQFIKLYFSHVFLK